MVQYTVKTALKALDAKNKRELAKLADCHEQSLYMLKDKELPSRLNVVVNLLVENKKLKKIAKVTGRSKSEIREDMLDDGILNYSTDTDDDEEDSTA